MKISKFIIALIFITSFNVALADNSETIDKISKNLRCLICQGQSVYDSQSDFAISMKILINNKINQGMNEDEIYKFLKSRYGEYILFKPPFQTNTLILWVLPFILIISGLIFFTFKFLKFRKND